MQLIIFMKLAINHFGIEAQKGKLDLGVRFFTELFEWVEYRKPLIKSWGNVRFVRQNGTNIDIQITEPSKPSGGISDLVTGHIAFTIEESSEVVKEQIQNWGKGNNTEIKFTDVSQGKFFITIPEVFISSFELIPKSTADEY